MKLGENIGILSSSRGYKEIKGMFGSTSVYMINRITKMICYKILFGLFDWNVRFKCLVNIMQDYLET